MKYIIKTICIQHTAYVSKIVDIGFNEFNIFMWDVLSKDYDTSMTGERCFERVVRKTKKGSIIVFHDSTKAESRLRVALPKVLEYFSKNGYQFCSIPA